MVANDKVFKGSKMNNLESSADLVMAMMAIIPSNLTVDDVVFLCIGTDRSTGDSLAPMVGTYLQEAGYTNIYGALDSPTHAVNLEEVIQSLPQDKKVIAIDASLGTMYHVGKLSMINGTIKPGAGVDKVLPEVGDYSILGTVNIGGFMEYHVLQNTRLSLVRRMAKDIVSAIQDVFPLHKLNEHDSDVEELVRQH
jgi:putative sporulation protein YyaC